ncbi:hypothetical protein LCY76_09515 [Fictibacillus sp. KIGAM418]|uniref:Uncharacterized protein n=1 Tax=Fictibacillus marinisediminis TaxID=2878389 RepID=A0A9X1XAX3_9BACL|nr:hypothetical protein [Fictibacillus marinisediminis]MCK6256831.1 hypothetical protein [Fictibacillus marinisediminis]
MKLFLQYFAGPLIAALITTVILWFKESKTEKKKHLNNVTFEQLTKVYNKLFILYYQYNSSLVIEYKEEVYSLDEEGEEQTIELPHVDNIDFWEKVIKEVKDIVYPNIHLLMRKDVVLWNEFLEYELIEEPTSSLDIVLGYERFKKFFGDISLSYIKLYNQYHLETSSVKKKRKKDYKGKLKNIKSNPFYSKEEKRNKIKKLKQKEQETISKIL